MQFSCRCPSAIAVACLLVMVAPAALAPPIEELAFPKPREVSLAQGRSCSPTPGALIEHIAADIIGREREVLTELPGTPQSISAGGTVTYDTHHCVGLPHVASFGSFDLHRHSTAFTDLDVEDPGSFFQEVDHITFVSDGDGAPGVDFELDVIAAVAEPSTWALPGLEIFSLVAK